MQITLFLIWKLFGPSDEGSDGVGQFGTWKVGWIFNTEFALVNKSCLVPLESRCSNFHRLYFPMCTVTSNTLNLVCTEYRSWKGGDFCSPWLWEWIKYTSPSPQVSNCPAIHMLWVLCFIYSLSRVFHPFRRSPCRLLDIKDQAHDRMAQHFLAHFKSL